jgi:hypothetical protein
MNCNNPSGNDRDFYRDFMHRIGIKAQQQLKEVMYSEDNAFTKCNNLDQMAKFDYEEALKRVPFLFTDSVEGLMGNAEYRHAAKFPENYDVTVSGFS